MSVIPAYHPSKSLLVETLALLRTTIPALSNVSLVWVFVPGVLDHVKFSLAADKYSALVNSTWVGLPII